MSEKDLIITNFLKLIDYYKYKTKAMTQQDKI